MLEQSELGEDGVASPIKLLERAAAKDDIAEVVRLTWAYGADEESQFDPALSALIARLRQQRKVTELACLLGLPSSPQLASFGGRVEDSLVAIGPAARSAVILASQEGNDEAAIRASRVLDALGNHEEAAKIRNRIDGIGEQHRAANAQVYGGPELLPGSAWLWWGRGVSFVAAALARESLRLHLLSGGQAGYLVILSSAALIPTSRT